MKQVKAIFLDTMAAFSLRLDLAKEVNGHFLENDYGDLSFFSVILNWVINFSM